MDFVLFALVVFAVALLVVDLAFLVAVFALLEFESLVAFVVLLATFSFSFASFIAPISALSKYKIRPQCGQVVMASALIKSTKILSFMRIKHPLHACFLIGTMLLSFAHLRIFS